jgi:hypothetical protein
LWIYLLEAGVALALLAFIVWWTLPGPSRDKRDAGPPDPRDGSSR